ncbi:hypothetical protein ANCDUO_21632, partial [Ancylostoma duodenale]
MTDLSKQHSLDMLFSFYYTWWRTSAFSETSMRPREMLASSTFYFLFAALFCCSFYANMFYNLYKTFAETFIDDDFFLARAFAIGSTANAIARVGWGYLTDRTSFQNLASIYRLVFFLSQ